MSLLPLALSVVAFSGFVVWASVYSERRQKARQHEMQERLAQLAEEVGGEFRPHGLRKRDDWSADGRRADLRFLRSLPYLEDLIPVEKTRIENLISLREGKVDVYAFEWVAPAEGRVPERRLRISLVRLTSRLPHLLVWPVHTPLAGTVHSLDMPVVGTEWAAFNRLYKVRSPNPQAAHGLLTPEIMEVLAQVEPCHWAVGGCYLYATPYGSIELGPTPSISDRVEGVRANIAMVRQIAALIPGYILEEGETGYSWPSPTAL